MGRKRIRCATCGKTLKSAILVPIGEKAYCQHCLRTIKVKNTGQRGKYYTHFQNRCFVEFVDKLGSDIQEFGVNELKIGNAR